MKKIFSLIAVLILLSGCDDGEMSFKTFDFDNGSDPAWCGDNAVYKIVGTEVLTFTFDNETAFPNTDDTDVLGVARQLTVTTSGNTLTYYNYSGSVTAASVCNDADLVITDPVVIDKWTGVGTVTIITNKTVNDGVITFNHTIELTDITFTKTGSDEQIRIQDNNFGSVATTRGFDFDFEDEETIPTPIRRCSNQSPIYKRKADEALQISIPDTLYPTTESTVEIDISTNLDLYVVDFYLFDGNATDAKMCEPNVLAPAELQHWIAQEGKIRIETSIVGGFVNHKIYLVDLIFYKQNTSTPQTYQLQDSTGQDGYLFGTFVPE